MGPATRYKSPNHGNYNFNVTNDTQNDTFDFYLNEKENLPDNKEFQSPLKRRASDPHNTHNENNFKIEIPSLYKRVKHYTEKVQINDNITASIFEYKTVSIFTSDDCFSDIKPALQEQATLITRSKPFLKSSKEKRNYIRSLIVDIGKNSALSENEKYAELGVLYFYIASQKEFLCNSSFVKTRTNEIEAEAKKLKQEHKKFCPSHLQKQLPSGVNAYLLRTFVRMIFTPDGGFNPGGCKALQFMMYSSLKLLIPDEQQLQIFRITNKLLHDENFRQLFKKPFKVHEDLEYIISIDLKIPPNDPINFIYVRWDLLMLLLAPLGQIGSEGNCFAVAPTANFITNHPEIILEIIIDVLKTGNFSIDQQEIPAMQFFENTADFYEEDFHESAIHKNLNAFLIVNKCLNNSSTAYQTEKNHNFSEHDASQEGIWKDQNLFTSELYEHLQHIEMTKEQQDNQQYLGHQTKHANQLFTSLKQNILQKLTLSIIQFAAINTPRKKPTFDFADKSDLINFFALEMSKYSEYISGDEFKIFSDKKKFLDNFKEIFSRSFYFVDKINGESDTEKPKGLRYTRNLFFLKQGKLIPITKISSFKECFIQIASELQNRQGAIYFKNEINEMLDYIHYNDFTMSIAKFLHAVNQEKVPFKPEDYKNSDLFIIAKGGGRLDFLVEWEALHYQLESVRISATSVMAFFLEVCVQLFAHGKTHPELIESKSWVLIGDKGHGYNLYPFFFQNFWTKNSMEQLDKAIFERSTKIEDEIFSRSKKARVLKYLFGERLDLFYESIKKKSYNLLFNSQDIQTFSENCKKVIREQFHERLDMAINFVINEIRVKDVQNNLNSILSYVGHNQELYQTKILEKIDHKFHNQIAILPYQLAKLIHKVLITSNPSHFASINFLEKQVRKSFGKPDIIELGNLNWIGSLTEKPSFHYLSIKYDFVKKKLAFCVRRDGIESALRKEDSDIILQSTRIFFPLKIA